MDETAHLASLQVTKNNAWSEREQREGVCGQLPGWTEMVGVSQTYCYDTKRVRNTGTRDADSSW